MKHLRSFAGTLFFLIIGIFIVFHLMSMLFSSDGARDTESDEEISELRDSLFLVAVGDSLTQGVGDSADNGGYVPITANLLRGNEDLKRVTTANYGVSGNRSDQVLQRIQEDDDLRQDIQDADAIVLTVGGNDVIRVFRQELLSVNSESFVEPNREYVVRLKMMFDEIRGLNEMAHMYVFGIYNPYRIYFSEIQELHEVINNWNLSTEETVSKEENATYLPLDFLFASEDLATDDEAIEAFQDDQQTNPYLYEEDLFHPNSQGYELMGEQLYEAIMEEQF